MGVCTTRIPLPWTLVKMHMPQLQWPEGPGHLHWTWPTGHGSAASGTLLYAQVWNPQAPYNHAASGNGSLGLGPRAPKPGAGWAGIEGGGARGGVAQTGGH